MKMRLSVLLVAATLMPFVGYADDSIMQQTRPDIVSKQLKHEDFKFYITAESGELKPAANNHYTLTLHGKNVANVIYKTMAPDHLLTIVPTKEFAKYWEAGDSFNKTPPNAGLVGADKKDGMLNMTYILTLDNITYKGGDTLSFDATMLSKKAVNQEVKLYKVVMIVDPSASGGTP